MAKDPISRRFDKKRKDRKLSDLAGRSRSSEEIEAEQELLEKTEKVEPIKADAQPARNEPCPCGSGKKYKKCCGQKQ